MTLDELWAEWGDKNIWADGAYVVWGVAMKDGKPMLVTETTDNILGRAYGDHSMQLIDPAKAEVVLGFDPGYVVKKSHVDADGITVIDEADLKEISLLTKAEAPLSFPGDRLKEWWPTEFSFKLLKLLRKNKPVG